MARFASLPGLLLVLAVAVAGCVSMEDGDGAAPIIASVEPCLVTHTDGGYEVQTIYFRASIVDTDCDLKDGTITLAVDGLIIWSGGGGSSCTYLPHPTYSAELAPGDELTYQMWARDGAGHLGGMPEVTWTVPDGDSCPPDPCEGHAI